MKYLTEINNKNYMKFRSLKLDPFFHLSRIAKVKHNYYILIPGSDWVYKIVQKLLLVVQNQCSVV